MEAVLKDSLTMLGLHLTLNEHKNLISFVKLPAKFQSFRTASLDPLYFRHSATTIWAYSECTFNQFCSGKDEHDLIIRPTRLLRIPPRIL